jgi:two-component system sensor histidine kinase RegB
MTVRRVNGLVQFVVADHGPGVSPEVLRRIGEPFFTTKAPGQGMGLGVFLARTIVERLGGDLQLRSEAGRGTTAIIAVPVAMAGGAGGASGT